MVKIDLRHRKFLELLEIDRNTALLFAADCLRKCPSPEFIDLMALMLEAEHDRWRFDVLGTAGRKKNDELTIGKYMHNRIDHEGIKSTAVVVEVKEKFEVGRSAAFKAMKVWKEHLENMDELQLESYSQFPIKAK